MYMIEGRDVQHCAVQAVFGDRVPSTEHLKKLDEVFVGQQSRVVVNRVVLVLDNFDELAAHCTPVSGFTALSSLCKCTSDVFSKVWMHAQPPESTKQADIAVLVPVLLCILYACCWAAL